MGITDWFKRTPPGSKVVDYAGPDYNNSDMWSLLSGTWPRKWNGSNDLFTTPTYSDMEKAYKHPVVGACIDAIKAALSEARLDVGYQDGNGDFESLENHSILKMLSRPNDFMTWNQLLSQWIQCSETTGFGYIWKIRGVRSSQVVQLIPIPTSWVGVYRAKEGALVEYYTIKGNKEHVPPEDMIVHRLPCPEDLFSGGAPLIKCWRDVILDYKRESFMVEMLENMKIPGLVVTKKSGWGSDPRKRKAEIELDEKVGEMSGRRGNSLLLEGDVDIKLFTPLTDLDWAGFSSSVESRICTAFGVPAIITGCRYGLDRSTYANMSQAEKALYTRTCRPKWVAYADSLTQGLIYNEGGDESLRFRFAFEELPQFQEDEIDVTTRTVMQYSQGIISLEEAREAIGYTGTNPDVEAYLNRQNEREDENDGTEDSVENPETEENEDEKIEEPKTRTRSLRKGTPLGEGLALMNALKQLKKMKN